jgi:hypothetical protein
VPSTAPIVGPQERRVHPPELHAGRGRWLSATGFVWGRPRVLGRYIAWMMPSIARGGTDDGGGRSNGAGTVSHRYLRARLSELEQLPHLHTVGPWAWLGHTRMLIHPRAGCRGV